MSSKIPTLHDPALSTLAFTHRSALNENPDLTESNERLEFLGDAVLELLVTEFLYTHLPEEQEGRLTSLRAALVKTTTLAQLARELKFDHILKFSNGEEQSGALANDAIMADTYEAFLGALYLDQGLEAVHVFLQEHLFPLLPSIREQNLDKDHKSRLQELLQGRGKRPPEYLVLEEKGPAHDRIFRVGVKIDGKIQANGTGHSKQEAQQDAARQVLEKL